MPKKLSDLKKAELETLAEGFAVDLEGANTKAKIIEALNAEGINDDVLASTEEHSDEPAESPSEPKKASKPVGETVIVKFLKANPTYEILGHRFLKRHPYVAMTEEEAQEVFDLEPKGFRIATPAEAKEFYS